MPEHVYIFLEASPDDAPLDSTYSEINLCGTYLHSLSEAERTQVLGSGLWFRGCYYGSVGAITEESVKKYIENQKSNIGGTD